MKDTLFYIVSVLLVFVAFAVFPIYSLYAEQSTVNKEKISFEYKLSFEKTVNLANKRDLFVDFCLIHDRCGDDTKRHADNYEVPYDFHFLPKQLILLSTIYRTLGSYDPEWIYRVTMIIDRRDGTSESYHFYPALTRTGLQPTVCAFDIDDIDSPDIIQKIRFTVEAFSNIFGLCDNDLCIRLIGELTGQ